LFSGLVEATPELDIVPALARTWDILDNGRRYVFHLRPDARWSDGNPVTAHDFEFAWKRQLCPPNDSGNNELFYDIKNAKASYKGQAPSDDIGIHATDDLTLVVELEEPVGHFLQLLATSITFAIPRHAVEAYGPQWATPTNIITNGPFRLETWRPDECIVLVRNPDYHGRTNGNVSRVELTLSDLWTPNENLKSYENDEYDIVGLSSQGGEQARQQHASEYVETPIALTSFVFFYMQRPPFNDMRVRQAFVHAADRVTMAEAAFRGFVSPATGGFVPPGLPGHSAGIGLPYAPERARQLLAEAGYPDGRGFPAIQAYHWGINPLLSQYLQQKWQEVLGINIQFTRMPYEDWEEQRLWSTTNLGINGWSADYPDPHNFLSVAAYAYFTPAWRNADYEHLLEVARHTTDSTERIRTYQAAERILIQEAAIMPLAYIKGHWLIKPWVKRYPVSPLSDEYWKDVIIEPH
jgi:ABC-type oligopeptide transport system substrate-binding subunit